jgi:hypothetical protein
MTSLYLHGLNSVNVGSRADWLQQFGKVINPLMQYRNYPENFQFLDKLIIQHHPDIIVASSMGGYFAFHLGNYYRIPTILLNPALLMTNIVKPDNRLLASDTLHTISIGKDDDVIPPWTTRAVLQQLQANHQIFEYNIGHKTSFDVFVDVCQKSGVFNK